MAQASSAQREPSMEEILASIRRIIEDSDTYRRPGEEYTSVPRLKLRQPPDRWWNSILSVSNNANRTAGERRKRPR
jgi:cell pole-organizing protein PopZ